MEFSRKEFVSMAFCAFGGAALSAPSFGKLKTDPALVAFLSDCHVGNWKSTDYQGKKFADCIARVLRLKPLPGTIIIPGDLAYLWGRKEDYELSRKLLKPVFAAGIAVHVAMGNHDRRENFLELWPECADTSPVKGRVVSLVPGKHCDFVVVDTLDQPDETDRWITPGKLDGGQREWLEAHCRAAKRPFIVVAHHPPHELGKNFGQLIAGTKDEPTKCCGYVHGHDHEWYVRRTIAKWQSGMVRNSVALPSTGHWGDIGYALMTQKADRAEMKLVQYDYFSPKPLPPKARPREEWAQVVRDKNGSSCTFGYS